jgi:pimeloyl-ACP methyl ester carboxylesterase
MKLSTLNRLKDLLGGEEPGGRFARNTALVTGSVALTAIAVRAAVRKARPDGIILPTQLDRALDADLRELEIMEGRTRYYHRPGQGTPMVFLHPLHVTGSSFDMRPLFDHFALTTGRPLYAIDWLGFGISDRPPVNYHPGLYQRQLRRVLSEHVAEGSDIIAAGSACEYAAAVLNAFPVLGRRLFCIAPGGLASGGDPPVWRQVAMGAAGVTGLYEPVFYRATEPPALRKYFQTLFSPGADIPEDLLDYSARTTRVIGAHYAVRRAVEGALSMHEYAARAYERLTVKTCLLVPSGVREDIQRFDLAGTIAQRNASGVVLTSMPGGVFPQWENPAGTAERIEAFFNDTVGQPA